MPVYKDKERGTYFYQYTKVVGGKKVQKKARGFKTKNAAAVAEIESQNELIKGIDSSILLYDAFDEYVKNTKSTIKPTSLRMYDQTKRLYLSAVPNKELNRLTINDVQTFKKNLISKKLSVKFTNKILNVMKNFLNYCVLVYDIKGNLQLPLMESYKDYSIVENEKKEVYIPPDDFEKVLDQFILDKEPDFYYYVILHVLYYTGLRIGELAALTINDYKENYLNINKDYSRAFNTDYVLAPKTKNSVRKVYLDSKTIELLNKYLERYKPDEILFSRNAKYLNQQKLRRVLAKALSDAGLKEKYDLHLHSLRHSHASYLRSLGYDEYLIAARLGNTPKVSASVYIHTTQEELQNLVQNLSQKKEGKD